MAGEGGFAKHLLTGHNAFYFDAEVFLSELYGLVFSCKVKPTGGLVALAGLPLTQRVVCMKQRLYSTECASQCVLLSCSSLQKETF